MLTRPASLLAAVLVLLAAPDAPAKRLWFIAGSGAPVASSAYYVATTGSDSNPGTLASPFLTLGKCQSAMQGGSVKTCYIRSGTYAMSAELHLTSSDNGETWAGYPGDAAQSAVLQYSGSGHLMMHVDGSSNVTISNLNFDGGSSGGNSTTDAAVFIENGGSNVYVQNNLFTNNFNQSDLFIYNSDSIYFRANTSDLNEYQPVSGHLTDGGQHYNWFITDNTLNHFARMGIELQGNSGGAGGVHIDRNAIDMTNSPTTGTIAISDVTGASGTTCSTIWGNTITGTYASGQWGVEIDVTGSASLDVEQNTMSNVDAPFFIARAVATGILNNPLSNWGGGGFGNGPFNQDGGFSDTQWVGTNALNGTPTAGWSGQPNTGSQPPGCSPSGQFPP